VHGVERKVYGVDAFQEHCRHVGQVNPCDRGLRTGTQFLTDGIILVLECSVQAVQERSDPDEHASPVNSAGDEMSALRPVSRVAGRLPGRTLLARVDFRLSEEPMLLRIPADFDR
jgi:hypothetical protein